jgi:hypothetical protein
LSTLFLTYPLSSLKSASAQVAERKVLTLEGAKKVIAATEAYASKTMLRAVSSPSWTTVATFAL